MHTCKIDDSELRKFLKASPKRAKWAEREALRITGYHLEKLIRKHIKSHKGWPPLTKETMERKWKYNSGPGKFRLSPLELFARLVDENIRTSYQKGEVVLKVGFFNNSTWFRNLYGVGAGTIAALHEKGAKSRKYGSRPKRPMIAPVWRKQKKLILKYFRMKFFKEFFSSKKRGIKY